MTVTSIPAPVAPPAPAKTEGSSAGEAQSGARDDGFASVLAGVHEHANEHTTGPRADKHATPAKSPTNSDKDPTKSPAKTKTETDATKPAGERGSSTDQEAPKETGTPTDPVTQALLAALAGTPRAARPNAASVPADAGTADAADPAKAAEEVAAHAGRPRRSRPGRSRRPRRPRSRVATALPRPNPVTSADDAAPDAADSRTDVPAPAAPTTTPAPKPAAPANANANANAPTPAPAPSALDAAAVAAATAAANATPVPAVRSEPAPKPDGAQDNAMLAAATAAVDRPATPEAAVAVAAPAAPTAPADPPPSAQLAAVIRPLQRGADGTYQIRIEMRPPELGRVDMRVEMRDGVIHASIHTEHAQTADLVRAALDDLRARLDADGVRSGQLTVDAQGAGTSGRDSQATTPERLDDPLIATTPEQTVVVAPTTTSDSLLDVRI